MVGEFEHGHGGVGQRMPQKYLLEIKFGSRVG